MAQDKDIGLDFEALKKLAAEHDAGIRVRTSDGRVVDITNGDSLDDLLSAGVDNHDRVAPGPIDGHDKVTSVHEKVPPGPGASNLAFTGDDGVFLSGLSDAQIEELRIKATDLLRGKEITIFKN